MQLMTVSAAARHQQSRSQLYKLMNDGWLDAHVHVQMPSGQRLLDVDGLQKTLQLMPVAGRQRFSKTPLTFEFFRIIIV